MRATAIFHVDHNCPELTITPMKGRIGADQKQVLTASFISDVETTFSTEITVHIRGGKSLPLKVFACAKIPDIEIKEAKLDFGGITVGDSKTLPFTIFNHSDIPAKLLLDIREYPEFELILPPPNPNDDIVSELMVPIQEDSPAKDPDPEELEDPLDEDMEDDEEDEEEQNRHVQLSLRPERSPLKL
jgi:hypothetical protein